MTKHDWKVGDCGIFCGPYPHMAGLVNRKAKIVQTGVALQLLNIQFYDGRIYSVSPDDLTPTSRPAPKDPFAPGEYVTCFREKEGQHRKIGDIVKVRNPSSWLPSDWFSYEPFDMAVNASRDTFRPATPEEIATYKAKYEAEPAVDPKPKTYTLTPYVKPETIMLHGVEYLVTENL